MMEGVSDGRKGWMPLMFQEKMRRGLVSSWLGDSSGDVGGGEGEGTLGFCNKVDADRRCRFEGGELMSGEEVVMIVIGKC